MAVFWSALWSGFSPPLTIPITGWVFAAHGTPANPLPAPTPFFEYKGLLTCPHRCKPARTATIASEVGSTKKEHRNAWRKAAEPRSRQCSGGRDGLGHVSLPGPAPKDNLPLEPERRDPSECWILAIRSGRVSSPPPLRFRPALARATLPNERPFRRRKSLSQGRRSSWPVF